MHIGYWPCILIISQGSVHSRGARSSGADARLCTSSGINLIVSLSFQTSDTETFILYGIVLKGTTFNLQGGGGTGCWSFLEKIIYVNNCYI